MTGISFTVQCKKCLKVFKADNYEADICINCEFAPEERLSTNSGIATISEDIQANHEMADTIFCFCSRCKRLFLCCNPQDLCYRCKVEMLRITILGPSSNRKRQRIGNHGAEENQLSFDFVTDGIRSEGI